MGNFKINYFQNASDFSGEISGWTLTSSVGLLHSRRGGQRLNSLRPQGHLLQER
jgi:hypothetical protein